MRGWSNGERCKVKERGVTRIFTSQTGCDPSVTKIVRKLWTQSGSRREMYWSSFILTGLKIRLGYRRCRGSQPYYVCFALSPGPSARSSFMNLHPSSFRASEDHIPPFKID